MENLQPVLGNRVSTQLNQNLLDEFYQSGTHVPSPLYIGSRKSQEFLKCFQDSPNHCFNPESLGVGLVTDPRTAQIYVTNESMNSLNSAFIAGVIKSRSDIICKAFLGSYSLLEYQVPASLNNARIVGGTLGEIGMLLNRGYQVEWYQEKNADVRDLGGLLRTIGRETQQRIMRLKFQMKLTKNLPLTSVHHHEVNPYDLFLLINVNLH